MRWTDLETMTSSAIRFSGLQNKRHFIYLIFSPAVDEEDRAAEANNRVHYYFVSRLLTPDHSTRVPDLLQTEELSLAICRSRSLCPSRGTCSLAVDLSLTCLARTHQ